MTIFEILREKTRKKKKKRGFFIFGKKRRRFFSKKVAKNRFFFENILHFTIVFAIMHIANPCIRVKLNGARGSKLPYFAAGRKKIEQHH